MTFWFFGLLKVCCDSHVQRSIIASALCTQSSCSRITTGPKGAFFHCHSACVQQPPARIRPKRRILVRRKTKRWCASSGSFDRSKIGIRGGGTPVALCVWNGDSFTHCCRSNYGTWPPPPFGTTVGGVRITPCT